MKRKLVLMLLTIITVVACVFGIVGCAKTSDNEHVHSYASSWSYDETYHWHSATCEHKNSVSDKERHTFLWNKCSVCGYERENSDASNEYSVIFDANNGSFENGAIIQITVERGNNLSEPQEKPYRTGYTFIGWSLLPDSNQLWDFESDEVSEDITLYAVWAQNVNIVFDANGGVFEDNSNTLTVEVKCGDKLSLPNQPTREYYEFTHWYKDSSLSEEWDFSTDTVSEEITLYAGWKSAIVEQDVTFVLNYAGAENVVMSTVNGLVTFIPTRAGYVFNGWWISDGQTASGEFILVQKWDTSEVVVEKDLTLYAEWVEESTVSSQLSAPSVSINGDVFTWSAITGAVRYDIRVTKSGSSEELISTSITNTTWTFPNGYDAGYYNVKIRAIGDGMNTVNSEYVSKSYGHHILSTISRVDFDITTSVLTWTTVRNATEYELYINNNFVEKLTYTTYDMSEYEAGSYEVRIVATRKDYESSTTSRTIEKMRLKTPELRVYVDKENCCYTLMWDSINYADTYILTINGEEIKVTDTTVYTFNNSASFWNGMDSVTFSMTAFDSNADYLVSTATDQFTVNKIYTLILEKNIDEAGKTSASGETYIPQTFKINFDLNGATGSISSQLVTAQTGISYPAIPTREGHVFRGWYTNKSCTELYDFKTEINRDITLYAGWQAMSTSGYGNYILDIRSNYNSSSKAYSLSTSSTSSSNAKYMYFRALTSGTYTLYYRNSSSTTNYGTYLYVYNATRGTALYSNTRITSTSYKSLTMPLQAGDVVYIRNYAYNTRYSATFYFYITGATTPDAGGLGTDRYLVKGSSDSKNTDSKIFVEQGTDITIIAETTDDRYFFDGWYNGDELVSEDAQFSYKMGAADVSLMAKWDYYSVTLDKSMEEAGTVNDYKDFPVKAGDSVTITAQTNNGYMWLGWYDGDKLLTTELTYTFTMTRQSVRYTARWVESPIILTQNMSDAGSVSGVSEPMVIGQTIIITAKTNSGYTWLGWYEGNQLKTKELSFEEELTTNKKEYTAKWIKVMLESDNTSAGTVNVLNGTYVVGDSATATATTKSGYTFIGWYNDDVKVCDTLSYTFKMPSTATTFTAKWIKVMLESDNTSAGTVNVLNGTYVVGDSATATATTKSGYTFIGWYNDDVKVCDTLSYTFKMPSTATTFTAKWIKVKLDKNISDAGNVSELTGQYIAGEKVSVTATTNEGYTWLGWFNGDEQITENEQLEFNMPTVEKVFTARWEPNEYTITLDANGGVLNYTSTVSVKFGEILTFNIPERTGYYFGGWFTTENIEISGETGEMLSAWNIAENTTLIAKWLRCISFNSNGGSDVKSIYVEPGERVNLPGSTKTGYTLSAWLNNGIACSEPYIMPDANITLSAQWQAKTYYIYYNNTSLKVTYGQYYSIPTPTKTGYTFRYFTLSNSTTRFAQSGTYNTAGNTSLTCKWLAELTRTVSAGCTIHESSRNLEKGMTFTITYDGAVMKNFHIETNTAVNVTFTGPGWTYRNTKSCGINSGTPTAGGSSKMVITITIIDPSNVSSFNLKFTVDKNVHTGEGL